MKFERIKRSRISGPDFLGIFCVLLSEGWRRYIYRFEIFINLDITDKILVITKKNLLSFAILKLGRSYFTNPKFWANVSVSNINWKI